jgi:hypothetical protein
VVATVATVVVLGLAAYVFRSVLAVRRIAVEQLPAREKNVEPEPDPLPFGYRLAGYEIREELAPGLMGRVYRANDTRCGRTVAINVLAPSLRDPVGRLRFTRSAIAAVGGTPDERAAGRFPDHVVELGEDGGTPFVVVKYVEGVGPAVDVARVPWGRLAKG